MPTLHFYGCSYGLYGTSDGNNPNAHKWITDNSIPFYLAKLLNMDLNNKSWAGACNYQILSKFTTNNVFPQEDDIIIFQWAHITKIHTNHIAPIWLKDSLVKNTDKEYEVSWYDNMSSQKLNQLINTYKDSFYDADQEIYRIIAYNEYIRNKVKCKFYYSVCDHYDVFGHMVGPDKRQLLYNESFLNPDTNYKTLSDFIANNNQYAQSCKHPNVEGCETIAKNYYTQIIGRVD